MAISIFVRAPHDALVHPETRFWNASGFELRTGGGGFRAKMESLQAVLLGGVGFETREESLRSPASPRDAEFALYADSEAVEVRALRASDLVPPARRRLGARAGGRLAGGAARHPGGEGDRHPPRGRGRTGARGGDRLAGAGAQLAPRDWLSTADPKELRPLVDHELGVLIDHGLRAELKSVSLLTGARVVALSFRPGAQKARLLPGEPFPEIPGAPGPDFDGLTESATQLLTDARRLVNSANTVIASPALADTIKNLDQITREASENLGPTLQSLPEGFGPAGEDAGLRLRVDGELQHRKRRVAPGAPRPPRGLALGAPADRLPRAAPRGGAAGKAGTLMRWRASFGLRRWRSSAADAWGARRPRGSTRCPRLPPPRGGTGRRRTRTVRVAPVVLARVAGAAAAGAAHRSDHGVGGGVRSLGRAAGHAAPERAGAGPHRADARGAGARGRGARGSRWTRRWWWR